MESALRARWWARHGGAAAEAEGDEGFSLIEVVISMTLLLIIVLALGAGLTGSMFASGIGRDRQVAITLGDSALDQARALNPDALTEGRVNEAAQWASPAKGVDLSDTAAVTGTPSSQTTPLPTSPVPETIDNQTYDINWYVGTCYQAQGGGPCGATPLTTQYAVTLYRVIVAVEWTASGGCASGCDYVTSTLISDASDPYFNINAHG